jgi:hypothetical protein
MYTEKRRQLRVDAHIPAEIIVKETKERLHGFLADLREEPGEWVHLRQDCQSPRIVFGYVENISEGGIGVSSLDTLLPGTKVITAIGPIEAHTISPSAILVFSKIDNSLYYYGFQFVLLSQDEQQVVKNLIRSLKNACFN